MRIQNPLKNPSPRPSKGYDNNIDTLVICVFTLLYDCSDKSEKTSWSIFRATKKLKLEHILFGKEFSRSY